MVEVRRIFGRLVHRPTIVIALALVSSAGVIRAANAAESWTNEPIFGLYYYPNEAHFDSLATEHLLPACEKALSQIDPLPTTLTLYARYSDGSDRIYIAGTKDDLGIYVIRGSHCEAGVPILAMLKRHHSPARRGEAPALSDAEIEGLFGDALVRYTKAFGGKDSFFHWLDSLTEKMRAGCKGQPELSCPQTYHLLLPAQQKQLEAYRRN
jgi:hypothetical protein